MKELNQPIRVGIVGYGNLARGAECALTQNPDLTLTAVFTRRDPAAVHTQTAVPVVPVEQILGWKDRVDVLLLCAGSATDLPEMTPALAAHFNVVDSYDNHCGIPDHFAKVQQAAQAAGTTAVISAGWDPGLFSLNRAYAAAILPQGKTYTFWGRGVSQGHSDAIRRIPGVRDARQYTIPVPEAMERVRRGEAPELTTREKHTRLCYVVAEEGADQAAIETAIKTMPCYFEDYDTTVHFITQEELNRDHSALPHGGTVIRSGVTGLERECRETIEYRLDLDSNPQFTASVLVACARAVAKLRSRGVTGCHTMLDLAPTDLLPLSREEILETLL